MEIEKTLTVATPAARIWQLLLDPNVMGACVPGMQSIEVISDVEYVSHIQVKIAFITARFRIKTHIVEMRAPHYLRSEGTGEDASVASSLKQESEIFLTELPDGRTELRAKVQVEVLGRLGTFGLSIMKTKADRMWDEFCQHLVARLESPDGAPQERAAPAGPVGGGATHAAIAPATPSALATAAAPTATPAVRTEPQAPAEPAQTAATAVPAPRLPPAATPLPPDDHPVAADRAVPPTPAAGGWLSRLLGRGDAAPARGPLSDICIEVRRHGETITVRWPVAHAQACSAWLRDYLKG